MNKAPKPKPCKVCRAEYLPQRMGQKVCSPVCAQKFGRDMSEKSRKVLAKAERIADKAKREAMKTRSDWMKEAQQAVNHYVRLRDHRDGCISCHRGPGWDGQWHASHFRSVGAASSVRFNLWNIHKACSICNNHLSGNIHEYTPRIIAKIGADKVEWLRCQNEARYYSIEYLKRLRDVFRRKAKRLQKRISDIIEYA